MSASTFTRTAAKQWMRDEVFAYGRHIESSGEVNMTSLAEACADAFDQADEGGPLDDSEHWLWEVALAVRDEHEEHRS